MPEIGNLKTIPEMSATPEINKLYPEFAGFRQKLGTAIDRMGEIQEAGGSGARYASIRDKTEVELIDLQYKIAKEHPELAYRKPEPKAEKSKKEGTLWRRKGVGLYQEVLLEYEGEMLPFLYATDKAYFGSRKYPVAIDKMRYIRESDVAPLYTGAVKLPSQLDKIFEAKIPKPPAVKETKPSVSKRGGLGGRGTPRITPKTPRLRR